MKFLFFILLLSFFANAQQENPNEVQSDGRSRFKTRQIKHPAAKEGLYLIDEEGVYHYRVKTLSKKDSSLFFRIISQSAPNIEGESGQTNSGTFGFEEMYSDQLTGFDFIYEWQPFKRFGKLGTQFGFGIATTTGKGYFKSADSSLNGLTPRESYTFFSIPISIGVVYRFEYLERQWAAPYIAGGGIYNGLVEYRNDGDMNTIGTPAGYAAGGMLINLTAFSKDLAFTMDREYGLSQLWVNLEYRRIQSLSEDIDISSNQLGVGIGADY